MSLSAENLERDNSKLGVPWREAPGVISRDTDGHNISRGLTAQYNTENVSN